MNRTRQNGSRRRDGGVRARLAQAPTGVDALRRALAVQATELRRLGVKIDRVERWNRKLGEAVEELKARATEVSPDSHAPAPSKPAKPRMAEDEYRSMVDRIRHLVAKRLPEDARILVVSKGDDQLLRLEGRPARHFPQREDGVYLGYYPADGAAVISHLESLRAKGAQYLLFPRTGAWWLDHYAGLRAHLELRGKIVCKDEACIIYALERGRPRKSVDPAQTWIPAPSPAPIADRRFSIAQVCPNQNGEPAPMTATAAIVVCVHNALEDLKRCLNSLACHPTPRSSLIIVDDGSNQPTRDHIDQFARVSGAAVIRNRTPRGYTLAANQGMRRAMSGSGHDYAVLLNSDTIVTPGWLERIVACGQSDSRIAAVGPLSNTASWQSIPELSENGDWAANPLPSGVTPADMAELVAKYSGRLYPRVGFLNGFCLAIKRTAIKRLGYFDEKTFGRGYGEENDFCMRARKARWELAIADDAYVFHAQSRSYSHDRRLVLCRLADNALHEKHGKQAVNEGVAASRDSRIMHGIRARARVMPERRHLIREADSRWDGRRVLFMLPSKGPNGGCNVVLQEASAMRAMGIDAQILNMSSNREEFERNYPDAGVPSIYIDRDSEASDAMAEFDAAIATINNSVAWMRKAPRGSNHGRFVRAYYVQDYEPFFYVPGSEAYQTAVASYSLFPDLVRFTKTLWNRDIVRQQSGALCHLIGPSVDIDLYRARRRAGESPRVRVAAMVRPSTPRRSPKLTMEVLRDLMRACGDNVEVVLFGCDPDEADFAALPQDFPWRSAGVLNPVRTASLLNEIDVFADFSSFQAMGLTALEAMACGVAVIVPRNGGSGSYARAEDNCLVVDSSSAQECLNAAQRLVEDRGLRERLSRQAVDDVSAYFPERAAFNILQTLFPQQLRRRVSVKARASAARRAPALQKGNRR
jgi:GT2 family glycosyltransferase